MPGSEGSSKVLERDGDHMVAEFVTPVKTLTGKHSYRTVEEVALYPDDRITFRALEGLWSASSVPGSQAATQGFTFSCAGYDFLSAKNIDFQKLKKHTFMVRIQAFMDAYYMDIKTLMKCCVGELFPGVRMIPFCAYNSVGYREQIRAKRTLSKTAK